MKQFKLTEANLDFWQALNFLNKFPSTTAFIKPANSKQCFYFNDKNELSRLNLNTDEACFYPVFKRDELFVENWTLWIQMENDSKVLSINCLDKEK